MQSTRHPLPRHGVVLLGLALALPGTVALAQQGTPQTVPPQAPPQTPTAPPQVSPQDTNGKPPSQDKKTRDEKHAGTPPTLPQATANPDDAVNLSAVTVTGSMIRGIDLETQHPLLVLEREDLTHAGRTDIGETLQGIVTNGQTQNRGIDEANDGRELINLRSLGPNRTLVLVNGQRWVSGIDGAVDLSAIPQSLVERVEVLRDGASALYGSDAIAGVINIITRTDYEGAELGGTFGGTDSGDGWRRALDFSYGYRGKGWNFALGFDYTRDDAISAGARAISAVPAYHLPVDATGVDFLTFRYRGRWTLDAGRSGASASDYRLFDPATDYSFNYAPYGYLQTPLERKAVFAQGHFEATPSLSVNVDLGFSRRRAQQQIVPARIAFGSFCCTGLQAFDYSAASVYNPFGQDITAFGRVLVEERARRWVQDVDTTRQHVNLDGLLDLGERSILWDMDLSHLQARQRESINPFVDNARLALAAGPSYFDANGIAHCGTPADSIDGCVPINLFSGPGGVTREMLDYVDASASNRMHSETWDFNLHGSTTLADLPAGALDVAAGVEYRHEAASNDPDAILREGRANGAPNYEATVGAYSVREAFAEFSIPLVADKPFARRLSLDMATRWSKYSLFSGTTNSQYAVRWKPVDDLLVRADYIEGFRAPSLSDLFLGSFRGGALIKDPCAAINHPQPSTASRCADAGVPEDVVDFYGTAATYGGNRSLRPESSRTHTLGLVYAPSWLRGLQASLDWYRIEIRGAIGDRTPQAIVDACYQLGDADACALFVRNPIYGNIVDQVDASYQNIPGGIETEGYDFTLQWQARTRLGQFQLRWDNAYVSYYGELGQPTPGSILPDGATAAGNVAGQNRLLQDYYGVIWRLRSTATLAWKRKAWDASIGARYFSAITESCLYVQFVAQTVADPSLNALCSDPDHMHGSDADPLNRVGAVTYFDLQAGWTAPWKGRISLGVRNAFDRKPPLAYSTLFNSYFPDYDVPGRYFYLSYRQKF